MAKRKELIENKIYRAIIGACEDMEFRKQYHGNGHHLAQRLTQMVSAGILSRQGSKIYNGLTQVPTRTKEIAAKCGLPSKQVSARLIQMKKDTLLVLSKKNGRFTLWYKA